MPDEKELKNLERGEEILREKVSEYKAAHPEALPEFDYALLLKSIDRMNDDSPVKIARNAFNEKREWIPGTETWNVSGVYLSDDNCITFTVSHGDRVMTVAQLLEALHDINKRLPLKGLPVMIQLNEETRVKATDLYAHSLVTSMWAGMPADFVLCFTQKKEKKKTSAPQADE